MDQSIENQIRGYGFEKLCGVDEVGRGPLAGPVTVAAVVLPEAFDWKGLDDSKKLNQKQREYWSDKIKEQALSFSVVSRSNREIDRSNILKVTKSAMRKAVVELRTKPDFVLLDAVNIDLPEVPQLALIEGDSRCPCIAAASVLAKVSRDEFMKKMSKKYPGYGFETNVGYGTAVHRKKIQKDGPCEIHRQSFIRSILGGASP